MMLFQQKCGLRAGNKLSQLHVHFKNQKMKVRLAVQVLSASVAASLKLAHQLKLPGFEDCLPTVKFIEVCVNQNTS